MNTNRPAVSPLALPELNYQLRIETARHLIEGYARICGDTKIDLERQIEAAHTGAATWTDTAGSVWGPGNLLVGGTVPAPGGQGFGLDLTN